MILIQSLLFIKSYIVRLGTKTQFRIKELSSTLVAETEFVVLSLLDKCLGI